MIRILMVGNKSTVKGGITTVITQLRQYDFDKHNIQLKFIPTYVEKNNIIKILFFIIAYIRILFYCLLKKPDIIHIHMSYKGSFARTYVIQSLAMKLKIKNIIHLHGSEFEKWYLESSSKKQKKIRALLSKCTTFIVLGSKWKEKILKINPNTKVKIVSNAISTKSEKVIFYENKITFLYLGVLIKRKGIEDLLNAIYKLYKENSITKQLEVIIAGDGKEFERLNQKSKDLSIDKYIKFVGWLDNAKKKEAILNSQFMILPSYNEGLPMSILEAMSYGMPIIASNVGDISNVVVNEKNGFLFSPGDVESLKHKIYNAINMKKEEYDFLSNNSKKIIQERYSEQEFFESILKIYSDEVKKYA